jgi:general stress protein 26
MTSLSLEQILDAARETILEAGFCFMITLDDAGHPSARLMQPFPPEDDLSIYFGASSDSRKVREILADPRITLGYPLPDQGAYVSMAGEASLITEPAIKLRYWRESFAEFWPNGPQDEGYAVIRFEPQRIELMNFSKKIAPEPYGLKAAVLVRENGIWRIGYA